MIYLKLFLTFLEIGLVSFGGGYGMISLIREQVLANGWLAEEELLNMIAVSESSPGPIAVNMATFIGSAQGGLAGALAATLGVVLPAFLIILLIASVMRGALRCRGVQAFLAGVRPCVVGLILATAAILFLNTAVGLGNEGTLDFRGMGILAFLALTALAAKKGLRKNPSPILMLLISAVLGVVVYAV